MVRLARLMHARSPIDSDNVYGLMEMRFADPAENQAADLPRLRASTESLADLLGSSGAGETR